MMGHFIRALALLGVLILSGCGGDYGPDQDGRAVAAGRLDDQWLVLNYWAEWCGPCRTEIAELNRLDDQLRGQGVTVLGVNFDNLQGANLKQAAQSLGIRFTVLAIDPASRFELPQSAGLPVTYIIDDHGQVREQLLGEQTAAGLQARLQALRQG
jgi:thiol-disulfide isomerase/thioredoxin